MKILITGGAGYIGSVLTGLLLERGDYVRVYDSLLFGMNHLFPFFRNPRYELIRGDIRDGRKLKETMKGVDAVIHLAAIVGFPACDRDPLTAQAVNTGGTETLDIVRNGHPVIFASTGSVYGKLETMCDESVTPRPLTVYGHSKLLAERLLLDSGNAMVYRFATAFGLSPRMRLDLLPNDFTYQAVSNRYLLVYERHYRRTFIHVYDIARALAHALDHFDRMTGQVYNCGSNDLNATKEAVVSLIATQTDFKVHYVDIGSDADQRDYEVDYKRLAETGFQTTVGLPDGIAEMVRAFRHLNIHNPYSNVG